MKKLNNSFREHGSLDYSNYIYYFLIVAKLLGLRFIYLGEVALSYSFYRIVDIVIVPSFTETGAIIVLEAMAAGKCVVTSNIYLINLYVSHVINSFLFNTPSEVAEIISNILAESVNIEHILAKAQEYTKNHDYRVTCKVLEQIHRQS
jgi:glycosyltransferase involved in cell wall biosynthesis